LDLIYYPLILLSNYNERYEFNTVINPLLSPKQIKDISSFNSKTLIYVYGYFPIYISNKLHLKNYANKNYIKLKDKIYYLEEETRKDELYIITENKYNTVIRNKELTRFDAKLLNKSSIIIDSFNVSNKDLELYLEELK